MRGLARITAGAGAAAALFVSGLGAILAIDWGGSSVEDWLTRAEGACVATGAAMLAWTAAHSSASGEPPRRWGLVIAGALLVTLGAAAFYFHLFGSGPD